MQSGKLRNKINIQSETVTRNEYREQVQEDWYNAQP